MQTSEKTIPITVAILLSMFNFIPLITDEGFEVPHGYERTSFVCMGKAVYCNSKASTNLKCIVQDRTAHIGGAWKAGSKKWAQSGCPSGTRTGTFDENLNRIGKTLIV